MATITQLIAHFQYSIDAGTGEPGRLELWDAAGRKLAQFGFVHEAATVPPLRLSGAGGARGFLKLSALPALLEMLRRREPLYLDLDDDPPGHVSIRTGRHTLEVPVSTHITLPWEHTMTARHRSADRHAAGQPGLRQASCRPGDRPRAGLVALCIGGLLLAGCSKPEPGAPAATASAGSSPAAASGRVGVGKSARVCDLVSQAEMSALLGAPVVATPGEGLRAQTECIYAAASGIRPYAELKLERGMGAAAMTAGAIAQQLEPGLADEMKGLGDQAVQFGPGLMIRTGEDLVTIVLLGVDDPLARTRRIFELAKARL